MPIRVDADIEPLTQQEFSEVAYEVMREAFALHLLGGWHHLLADMDVLDRGVNVARQSLARCGEKVAFRVTTFQDNTAGFSRDLMRFGRATGLRAVQWINISRQAVEFRTLPISSD